MAENIRSGIFKTGLRNMMLAGIVLLVLAFTAGTGMAAGDTQTTATAASIGTANAGAAVAGEEEPVEDIEDYDGSIGPGSSLYGLKLAFEGLDETFTFKDDEKIGKKVAHAKQRIAEAKAELRKKNDEAAVRAIEKYREKIKETEEAVSEASGEDKGLLDAQEMIAKHQAVLSGLLESHPGNRGLARAYNNSLELTEKFEEKTGKEFVLASRNGRKVLRQIEIDETEEKIKIKAKIIDNATQVEVEVKFASDSTDNFTIAREIVSRLQLSEENINRIIKIEEDDDEDEHKLKEELEAKAEVKGTISKVEAEYRFPLDKTNESDIVKGVHQKLSALTQADILKVLEMKVKKEHKEKEEREEREEKEEKEDETLRIKAKITDNATRVKVEVKFESGSTDNFTIAREIVSRLQLSEENINRIIKIEKEDEEQSRLKEKLEAKAEVKGTISKVEAEYEFPLKETNESRIAGGIRQKLSALTQSDILKVLEMKVKDGRKEVQEKEEKEVKQENKGREKIAEKAEKLGKKDKEGKED